MPLLRIEVDGRALSFPPDKVVRIGRSIDADVVLSAVSVSRAHAELRPTPSGWVLADAGSSGGTFVDGARITERPIHGRTVVQCGPPAPGSTLTVDTTAGVAPVAPASPAPGEAAPVRPTAMTARPPAPAPPPAAPVQPVQPGHQGESVQPAQPGAPASWAPPAPGATPVDAPAPSAAAGDVRPGPEAYEMTIAPGRAAPIIAGAPGMPGAPQPSSGPDLLVVAEGREHRFRHPATITIGRLPDNDVVINDPGVSRQHARIVAKPGGWVFQNGSQSGSFAKGKPVTNLEFDDTTDIRLGHPTAGELLSLVPILSAEAEVARIARRRRSRRLRIAAAVVSVVVVAGLVGGGIALLGGGDDQPKADSLSVLTRAEQDRAEAATVLISYEVHDASGDGLVTGSGSILTKDGVILTNAHVAAPEADGLEEIYGHDLGIDDPDYVEIHLTDPDNGYFTGEADYRAKVLAADGHVDAAVIGIYADADGNPVDPSTLDLPTMPQGDSDTVENGDAVTVLGFPGIARSGTDDPFQEHPEVTVTKGVVATIINSEAKGKRWEFDTDARIAPGNSGGAAVNNDGALIGVPSSTFQEERDGQVSGRIRPLAKLLDLIKEGESAQR
ncbi:FHA domain-containing protein [Nocardioides sp. DS6]|uniref:FHA domain-containing protein n=1 Tax=Nocardioides eburneus TaxID=3231482 RepID=A0ABV3SWR4_9ACTN